MSVWYTKEMFIPDPGLVPPFVGQWGHDDSYWQDDWGTTRRMSIMPWHSHVVAEGIVDDNDRGLRRALRDERIL